MPNHIHGIIITKREACRDVTRSRPYMPGTLTENKATNVAYPNHKNNRMSVIAPKRGSLAVIIGGWKSKCSKEFKKLGHGGWFSWQPRFHDHIIHSDSELNRLRQYIRDNPPNWETDEDNPVNGK